MKEYIEKKLALKALAEIYYTLWEMRKLGLFKSDRYGFFVMEEY